METGTYPYPPSDDILDWFKANLTYDEITGFVNRKPARYCQKTIDLGRNHDGYRRWTFRGREYLVHHIVWFLCKGYWPPQQLDHIDRTKSHNRIENLRLATAKLQAENSSGRRKKKIAVVENTALQCFDDGL